MSLNIDELWIGDKVKLLSSGEVGTFEGKISNSEARIRLKGYRLNVSVSDLEIFIEPPIELNELLQIKEEQSAAQTTFVVPDELDLHIEVLDKSMKDQMPERILNFQTNKAKQYIERAIQKRKYKIKIIHGKGTGVLKSEINHLLKSYKEILFTHEVNNGGAVEVLFTY